MTDSEWHAYRMRWSQFAETELGKLYLAYNNACIAYWRHDQDEQISTRRLDELGAAFKAAARALSDKLMELAGV